MHDFKSFDTPYLFLWLTKRFRSQAYPLFWFQQWNQCVHFELVTVLIIHDVSFCGKIKISVYNNSDTDTIIVLKLESYCRYHLRPEKEKEINLKKQITCIYIYYDIMICTYLYVMWLTIVHYCTLRFFLTLTNKHCYCIKRIFNFCFMHVTWY